MIIPSKFQSPSTTTFIARCWREKVGGVWPTDELIHHSWQYLFTYSLIQKVAIATSKYHVTLNTIYGVSSNLDSNRKYYLSSNCLFSSCCIKNTSIFIYIYLAVFSNSLHAGWIVCKFKFPLVHEHENIWEQWSEYTTKPIQFFP